MLLKRVAFLLAIVVVSGCGGPKENIKDSNTIAPSKGVIVAHIVLKQRNTQVPHHPLEIGLIKDSSVAYAATYVVSTNSSYVVTQLPPGNYSWAGMHIDGAQYVRGVPNDRSADFHRLLPFEVKADELQYIGDVEVTIDWADPSRYRLRIASHADWAKSFMDILYPKMIASHPLEVRMTEDRR